MALPFIPLGKVPSLYMGACALLSIGQRWVCMQGNGEAGRSNIYIFAGHLSYETYSPGDLPIPTILKGVYPYR